MHIPFLAFSLTPTPKRSKAQSFDEFSLIVHKNGLVSVCTKTLRFQMSPLLKRFSAFLLTLMWTTAKTYQKVSIFKHKRISVDRTYEAKHAGGRISTACVFCSRTHLRACFARGPVKDKDYKKKLNYVTTTAYICIN